MSTIAVRNLVKRFGNHVAVAGIDLDIPSGQVLGLLGPSGCGKTTTLRCLAGLEEPDAGEIWIDDRPMVGTHAMVPPERRGIGMVFQSYALWPHLTVARNVAYPLEIRHVPKDEIRRRVIETLSLVGLEGLGDRYPSQISGGQQQRVAVARSIIGEPKVLLFDEPLSNLDANTRIQVRGELKRLLQRLRITSVYVTHDQIEAMAICERVVLMDEGRVIQDGPPDDLHLRPATLRAAEFLGSANIVRGIAATGCGKGDVCEVDADQVRVRGVAGAAVEPSAPAVIVIRRQAVRLGWSATGDANSWRGRIRGRTSFGDYIEYIVDIGQLTFTVESSDRGFEVDQAVDVHVDPDAAIIFATDPAEP